jgi:predicted RND superfamily exporter protein
LLAINSRGLEGNNEMKNFSLVQFSVEHPRIIVLVTIIITLAFATQFPKVKTDTNPKNMLPGTSDVRVCNEDEKTFGFYEDTI